MSTSESKADSYAAALTALADASGVSERIEKDLCAALDLLESEEVRAFLRNPFVFAEGKKRTLGELMGGRVSDCLLHVLCVMAAAGDLAELPRTAERVFQRAAQRGNEVAGEVILAHQLSVEKIATIEREVGAIIGKSVRLHARIDPDIAGGVVVRVGDVVFDGSVRRELEEISRRLVETPA